MLDLSIWLHVRIRYSSPSCRCCPLARCTAAAACGVKLNSGLLAAGGTTGLGGVRSGGGVVAAAGGMPEGDTEAPPGPAPAEEGRGQEAEARSPAASACCACHQACSDRMQSATTGRSPASSRSAADRHTNASLPPVSACGHGEQDGSKGGWR